MSDIHSVEEAYEKIAEAMNYLREHREVPWFNDDYLRGRSASVHYSNPKQGFYVYAHNKRE